MPQRHHTNFDDFSLARVLGDAWRAQHKLSQPLPSRLLALLAELDAAEAARTKAPPIQPEQTGDVPPTDFDAGTAGKEDNGVGT
jgi:hypothetical protein